jgi:protein-export membrane protein SecD
MLYPKKSTYLFCFLMVLLGLCVALPSALSVSQRQSLPSWFPSQTVNLGLDLQGGVYVLLQANMEEAKQSLWQDIRSGAAAALREAGTFPLSVVGGDKGLTFTFEDKAPMEKITETIRGVAGNDYAVKADQGVVRVSLSETGEKTFEKDMMQKALDTLRVRLNETGLKEPSVQQQGKDLINVQFPGVDDPSRIKDILGRTAKLSFHLVDETLSQTYNQSIRLPASKMALSMKPEGDAMPMVLVLERRAMVTGEMLSSASTSFQDGLPVVAIRFNTVGAKRFGQATAENVNRRFAIVLDQEIISAPVIRDAIPGGNAVISGGFTAESAGDLALLLRSGSLPVTLKVIEERTVGASLGADAIRLGQQASLIGLIVVMLIMIVLYGLFGIYVALALVINMVLLMAALVMAQATLTLPGIAGIILTLGMAVDTNILIFERIREECLGGLSLGQSLSQGYHHAMTTIIDANMTTFISSAVLLMFGTGPIKGFATTLIFGLVTSLFTGVVLTRLMIVRWYRRQGKQVRLPILAPVHGKSGQKPA